MPAQLDILTGSEALSPDLELDFIAPHPYGSDIELDSEGRLTPVLSVLSKISLDATITAWESHPEATVVIAGETCYPGMATTTDLMVERAHAISDIPDSAIVALTTREDGHGYNNTYLQTEGLAQYFNKHAQGANMLSISLAYHIRRVMKTAEKYGWEPAFVPAEDVLHARGIHDYDEFTPYIANLESSEKPLRLLAGKGRLFNLMMEGFGPIRGSGPRMVNVLPGEDGKLELIATTSAKRREAVASAA